MKIKILTDISLQITMLYMSQLFSRLIVELANNSTDMVFISRLALIGDTI